MDWILSRTSLGRGSDCTYELVTEDLVGLLVNDDSSICVACAKNSGPAPRGDDPTVRVGEGNAPATSVEAGLVANDGVAVLIRDCKSADTFGDGASDSFFSSVVPSAPAADAW